MELWTPRSTSPSRSLAADRGGWDATPPAAGSSTSQPKAQLGLTKRIDAWCEARDIPEPDRIRFLPDVVNMLDDTSVASAELSIATMPEPPALIVTDTMARTMIGGDENCARDVGRFVAAVDQLRAAAGDCTALVVHPTGKRGDDERGSSALRGAAAQTLALSHDSGGLRLDFTKIKDYEPLAPLALHPTATAECCAIRH